MGIIEWVLVGMIVLFGANWVRLELKTRKRFFNGIDFAVVKYCNYQGYPALKTIYKRYNREGCFFMVLKNNVGRDNVFTGLTEENIFELCDVYQSEVDHNAVLNSETEKKDDE